MTGTQVLARLTIEMQWNAPLNNVARDGTGLNSAENLLALLLAFAALAAGFIKEDGGGGADVQGIHAVGHGNQDGLITHGQDGFGDAIAFAAEHDAAITSKIS